MNTKELSELIIKLGGMFIIVETISGIPEFISAYSAYSSHSLKFFISLVVLPNIIPILIGIFLFNFNSKISDKIIVSNIQPFESKKDSHLKSIESVALSVLGFYLLSVSIADIIYLITGYIKSKSSYYAISTNTTSNLYILTPSFISTLSELFIAIWLIYCSKRIAVVLLRFRSVENKEK